MLEGCDDKKTYRVKMHLLALGFFALLTFAIFRNYFTGAYPLGTDALGLPTDLAMMESDGSYFSSWRGFISLGHLNYPSPILSAIYYFVGSVLQIAPLDFARSVLVLSFLLSGVAMYVCAYKLIGNWTAGLVAGSVYCLNQVALSQVLEAHYFFVLGYAIFPLLFLVFFQVIRGLDKKSVFLLPAMAVIFGCVSAPHTVLITAIFLTLFSAVYVLNIYRRARLSDQLRIRSILSPAIISGITILLLVLPISMMRSFGGGVTSLYTHYPIEEAASYSSNTIINSLILGSTENTFIYGTTGGEWTIPGFLWPLGLLVAMIIPTLALLSVLLKSKKDLVLPLLVPALVFVIIAMGPNFVLGDVFTWAFKTIPLMDSIRAYSRFLLLTAFSFSILIGMVFSNLGEIRAGLGDGKISKLFKRALARKRTVAILLALGLVFPSGAAFSGEFRSFDLPAAYSEPYEWLHEQDGDFRLITLPLGAHYYESDWTRVDGYPNSKTSDVGLYSPLISNKQLASGMESIDYWNFINNAINEGEYGYLEIPQMLGGTAAVQYVVAQVYASPQEIQKFESLDGVTVLRQFDGGATLLINSYYSQRVHALTEIQLAVGGRNIMLTALGLNITDENAGRVLVNQLWEEGLEQLLPYFGTIILGDADTTELLAWTGNWTEQERIKLSEYGDVHTYDSTGAWRWSDANYSQGISSQPTVETKGKASLSVPVETGSGNYSLAVKAMYGPLAGDVNVLVDGELIGQLSLKSDILRTGWITLPNISVSKGMHEITFTNVEGSNSLEMLLFASQTKMDDQSSWLSELLDEYQEKVTITISGAGSRFWTSGFSWSGEKGNGIAPTLSMDAAALSGNTYLPYDPISRFGRAQVLSPNARSISSVPVGGFDEGASYEARLSLRLNGTTEGDVCRIDIIDPYNGTTIASQYVTADELSSDKYITVPVGFVAPSGTVQFTITSLTSNATINWDGLEVIPSESRPLEAQLEFLYDGTYAMTIDADDPQNISVSIDNVALESLGSEGGLLKYEAPNITEGTHTLRIQSSAVYALEYGLAGGENATGQCNVGYEKLSDTQYSVQVNCTEPTWLLLSEGYDSMWDATLDGEEAMHLPIDSIVNAYYVPTAGNHTINITYGGQTLFENMVLTLLLVTVASTATLWVLANGKELIPIIARMKRYLRI